MATTERDDVSPGTNPDKPRFRWWLVVGALLMIFGALLALGGLMLAGVAVFYNSRGVPWSQTSVVVLQSSRCLFGGLGLLACGVFFARRRFRWAIVAGVVSYAYFVALAYAIVWLIGYWGLDRS